MRNLGQHVLNEELVQAAVAGDVETARILIQNGADLSTQSESCISVAAHHGHIEIMALLIEHSADIHHFGEYALRKAAGRGHVEMVEFLIAHGADVTAMDSLALRWAAQGEEKDVMALLIEKGATYETFSEPFKARCRDVEQEIVLVRKEQHRQEMQDRADQRRTQQKTLRHFIRRNPRP